MLQLPPGLDVNDLNPPLPDVVVSTRLSSQATGDPGSNRQRFTRETLQYDNPFIDMTSTFIPARYKDVLRLLAASILNNGLVCSTLLRMSEYPITDLIYSDKDDAILSDDKTEDFWKEVLEKIMRFRDNSRQCGINYHGYGNGIVSINFPFKRMLKCECGAEFDAVANNARYVQYKFEAKCPKCKKKAPMVAKDVPTKEMRKLRYVHWDLLQMDIKYNTVTGEHFYYWTPDKEIRRQVSRGDMDIINGLRLEVLEAIRTNRKLRLSPSNVFHMKRIGPQYVYPQERGWGISILMSALKDIFHAQILKKGNESIAFDHINPLRVLYPNAVGEISPHSTINLGDWRNKVEDEILKWRTDPNHISVMPIPIGLDNLFGDAKALMVHQELRATEDNVITSLGVIPELVRGGASWSGSSVSLRVVENSFLNYRGDLQMFLDWTVNQVGSYFRKTKIKVRFSDFKMADDIQQKQLILSAANGPQSQTLISRSTTIKELGFNPREEYDQKLKELRDNAKIMLTEQETAAEAAGSAGKITALFQADAQVASQDRLNDQQQESAAKQDQQRQQEAQANVNQVQADIAKVSPTRSQEINMGDLIMNLTRRFTLLQRSNPDDFAVRMLAMKNATPGLYAEVYKNLKELNTIKSDTMPNLQSAQLYTPGNIPTTSEGGVTADDSVDPAAQQDVPDAGIEKNNPVQKPPNRDGGSPM